MIYQAVIPLLKNNFITLKSLVLAGSPQDKTLVPWETSLFEFYNFGGGIDDITETPSFKNDTFGLKTLYSANRVHIVQPLNVLHDDWLNKDVFSRFILRFL